LKVKAEEQKEAERGALCFKAEQFLACALASWLVSDSKVTIITSTYIPRPLVKFPKVRSHPLAGQCNGFRGGKKRGIN
jgi:hypothetical protein